jgi:hypothetical protein
MALTENLAPVKGCQVSIPGQLRYTPAEIPQLFSYIAINIDSHIPSRVLPSKLYHSIQRNLLATLR